MITAMILAGGVGSRVGAERPKQFVEVCGKPILAYTIEIYQKNPQVEAIEIVCHADWIDYLKEMIENYDLSKVKWITHGGETFQKSVIPYFAPTHHAHAHSHERSRNSLAANSL